MNKKYVKRVQKWEKAYLRLIDSKMVTTILVLYFNVKKRTEQRPKRRRKDIWDCHLTLPEDI